MTPRAITPIAGTAAHDVFLATTALEDFWDTDKSVLFLGHGCLRFSRRQVWEKLHYTVAQSPLADRAVFYARYRDVEEFDERMIQELGRALNALHGTSHSTAFWRMTVGPWLQHYIHMLYERYTSVRAALDACSGRVVSCGIDERDFFYPQNTEEFFNVYTADLYNLQVYTRILQAEGVPLSRRRAAWSTDSIVPRSVPSPFVRLMTTAAPVLRAFSDTVARQAWFPSKNEELKLFLKTRGRVWFDYQQAAAPRVSRRDPAMRVALSGLQVQPNGFEQMFARLIADDVPAVFVEGFKDLNKAASAYYRRRPRVILTSGVSLFDEVFKCWSALCEEKGTEIRGMQHGTNYGVVDYLPIETLERRNAKLFYTWGWEDDRYGSTRAMPATKYIGVPPIGPDNRRRGILMATTFYPRYLYRFHYFRHYDNEAYFAWQQQFVGALPPELRDELSVRFPKFDFGCDCRERWQAFDPRVKWENLEVPFAERLSQCRLHVSDHMASTFTDGFLRDVPTLLFWDPELYPIRLEAKPFVERLCEAGILFYNPREAAVEAARIYSDVETWWKDSKRQDAVRFFCDRYARTAPDALDQWARELVKK